MKNTVAGLFFFCARIYIIARRPITFITMSDIIKNTSLVIVSTLVALIVVGGGYEWMRGKEYDAWRAEYEEKSRQDTVIRFSSNERLMWEYIPYAERDWLQINRYGFRDEDLVTKRKPDGVYRIAFIGDSVTLGLNEEWENTFVRQFQQLVDAQPELSVQAMNFGVSGYHTRQIRELLSAEVMAFEPDEVIYVMCLNDFDFEDASEDMFRYFNRPKSFVIKAFYDAQKRFSDLEYHEYHFEKNREEVYDLVEAMSEIARQADARFKLVILPVFTESDSYDDYPYPMIHADLKSTLEVRGIEVEDFLSPFAAAGAEPRHWAFDIWHFNETGHRLAAELLFDLVFPQPAPPPG